MVALTGCDAVMIGRAAAANPWIFRQIAQYTATGSYERPTAEDRYRMIRAYFQMLLDEAEATKDLPKEMKQLFVETPQLDGPYGARGVGEHPMISIPSVIGNALYDALGIDFHELPLTSERVYLAIKRTRAESKD